MADENEALDSADSATDTTSSDVASPEALADSSPAEGAEPSDVLSIVRDAVNAEEPKGETASPAEDDRDPTDTDGSEDAQAETQPDDGYTDVPFHQHPRFQQLIQERNTLRGEAGQFRKVQAFLDENGLSSEDAANMLSVAALAQRDPAEAWKQVKPWVQDLLMRSGEYMPNDLRDRVQKGELSRDAALEISRLRVQQQSVQARTQFDERRQQMETARSMQSAAGDWETQARAKDPDFVAKLDDIQKEVLWLQRRDGVPNSAHGVKAQLDAAYRAVNDRVRAQRTPKPAKQPVRSGKVAGGEPQRAPTSVLDIVRNAGAAS